MDLVQICVEAQELRKPIIKMSNRGVCFMRQSGCAEIALVFTDGVSAVDEVSRNLSKRRVSWVLSPHATMIAGAARECPKET